VAERLDRLRESTGAGYLVAAVVVTLVTLALYPLQRVDPGVSSGVLYVLGVLGLTVIWGLRLGLITSVVSALALGIFHTSPSSGVEAEDLAAIGVLLVTEIVAAFIADQARHRIVDAEARLVLEAELREREVERARLDEVQASRARVIAAGDEERKRVVRDLHDGAQQRLVHTVIRLKLTHRALARGDVEQGAELAAEALTQAEAAVTELRELAHGILPAVLARGGLPAGVAALADRMEIPIQVDVCEGRLAPAIEATAYFVVAEALTNVAKHSGAERAEACAVVRGDELIVTIADDGHGGANGDGNGLTGLRDRLAVLGGELAVGERDGGGTVVEATIPLGAGALVQAAGVGRA
jgi:signal transduction histidine kinase